MMVYETALLIV